MRGLLATTRRSESLGKRSRQQQVAPPKNPFRSSRGNGEELYAADVRSPSPAVLTYPANEAEEIERRASCSTLLPQPVAG